MINIDLKYESYLLYLQALPFRQQAVSYNEFHKLLFAENEEED